MALDRVRETNETLRQSEEHLRLVFEAAVDGIVELDQRDVILRANDAFCGMVRIDRESIEGQPWTALAASVERRGRLVRLAARAPGRGRSSGPRGSRSTWSRGSPRSR